MYFVPNQQYLVRSGPVVSYPGRVLLPVGTKLVFTGIVKDPSPDVVHPHDAKKYIVYDFDGVQIPLPVMRVYPDKENKETWYDNAPALMFQPVSSGTKTPTKILFLDIDGVLNNDEHMQMLVDTKALSTHAYATDGWFGLQISPVLRSRLQKVLDAVPNLRVVVSSSWRFALSTGGLSAVLKLPVHDITIKRLPNLKFSESAPRGAEIQAWLDDNAASGPFIYAVVDDLAEAADGYDTAKHREVPGLHRKAFVHTDGTKGLTDANVNDIIRKLMST